MNRKKEILKKLHSLSSLEEEEAITFVTRFVRARLRMGSRLDRTKSGAHSEQNLGEEADVYYVSKAIMALYEPEGWDWKYEDRTLGEQLKIIANKFISDEVKKYKSQKVQSQPKRKVLDKDISELFEELEVLDINEADCSTILDRIYNIAIEVSSDDDELNYFTLRYLEKASFTEIADEMNCEIKYIYTLRRKLVRRLESKMQQITL